MIIAGYEYVCGIEKSYFFFLSAVIATWFVTKSYLSESNPAIKLSHLTSTNLTLTPNSLASASDTSTS